MFKSLLNEWISSVQPKRVEKISVKTSVALHDFADWLDRKAAQPAAAGQRTAEKCNNCITGHYSIVEVCNVCGDERRR